MSIKFENCDNTEERVKTVLDGMHLQGWYNWYIFDTKWPNTPDSLLGWVANELMNNIHGCRYVRVISGDKPVAWNVNNKSEATIDVIVGVGPSMINLKKTVVRYVIEW